MGQSRHDPAVVRERLLTKGESDFDSIYLSNFENEIGHAFMKKNQRSLVFNYLTGTENELGVITNHEESATDGDFDFKSLIGGLGNSSNRHQEIFSEIKKKITQHNQMMSNLGSDAPKYEQSGEEAPSDPAAVPSEQRSF